ncbi:MAG: putative restriction endonuclease [Akkermansiaceae bacterium]|jgi:putative restriction endonuclease
MTKTEFEASLAEHNTAGSGKASSYLKALEWLGEMLEAEPYQFCDCLDLWTISSVDRLVELRSFVLEEQKKQSSPWNRPDIPISYLRDGYCAAALTQMVHFLPQQIHVDQVLETYRSNRGDPEDVLNQKLDFDPKLPSGYVEHPNSKEGLDVIREAKARIGQAAFRKMVLENYQNTCGITGLDIPTLNRASHIIGWAEKKSTRMLPTNGICLSATYDAAFDKKLISFDEDYRLIVSQEIQDHYTRSGVRKYFKNREGQMLTLPKRDAPSQTYLEEHRKSGVF